VLIVSSLVEVQPNCFFVKKPEMT